MLPGCCSRSMTVTELVILQNSLLGHTGDGPTRQVAVPTEMVWNYRLHCLHQVFETQSLGARLTKCTLQQSQ